MTAAPASRAAVLLALAGVLAALAGFVDATGFVYFHALFVSFMSGNSTQVAVALAHGDAAAAVDFGRTIALFVGGIAAGELIAVAGGRWRRPVVLAVEALCLGAALLALRRHAGDAVVTSLLTSAMGVQNAVLHRAAGVNVGLTYVTGTLVQIGRGLAEALRGAAPWRRLALFAWLWLGLTGGGLGGALVAARSVVTALTAATGCCVGVLAAVLVLELAYRDSGGLDEA